MSDFTDSVNHYCDGLIVNPGCLGIQCEHSEGDEEHRCESYFSWQQCDSCGSTFGGNRETAYGINNGVHRLPIEPIELSICTDCALFHANGDEPDQWSQHP